MLKKSGFTLTLLLVVLGTICIAIGAAFISIDPIKYLRDTRNARRTTDSDTILAAVHQYIIDNGGSLPAGVGATPIQLGTCTDAGSILCRDSSLSCVDLAHNLSNNKYLRTNPVDPQGGSPNTTGYSISKDSKNVFTVTSCLSEGITISISR